MAVVPVAASAVLLVLGLALSSCGSPWWRGTRAAPASRQAAGSAASASATTGTVGLTGPSAAAPCGHAGPVPHLYQHVVLIVEENRGFSSIIGSPDAPYLNGLAARCGLATNYRAVAHPSLPNYLALTSGSVHGITDDAGPAAHPVPGPSIFSQLNGRWRALQESMPGSCALSSSTGYAVKHDPAAYYTGLRPGCRARVRPLTQPPDLSAAFTFITPNVCHDMHNGTIRQGDIWLSERLPAILDSPQYRSGSTAVVITWDESEGSGRRVATLVIAPTTRAGTRSAEAFTHFSLLRTVEQLLGLHQFLGAAATAPSMRSAFHL